MMVKWVYDHTLISPSLTSILQLLAWSKPSFAHLTIIEKLLQLHMPHINWHSWTLREYNGKPLLEFFIIFLKYPNNDVSFLLLLPWKARRPPPVICWKRKKVAAASAANRIGNWNKTNQLKANNLRIWEPRRQILNKSLYGLWLVRRCLIVLYGFYGFE